MKFFILRLGFSIALGFIALAMGGVAKAATINLIGPARSVPVGSTFTVSAELKPDEVVINALEGTLEADTDRVVPRATSGANSIITWWVTAPVIQKRGVVFSGIIPGGFQGVFSPYAKEPEPGKMFSVDFEAREPGSVTFSLSKVSLLSHDGKATVLPVTVVPLTVNIIESQGVAPAALLRVSDTTPPSLVAERAEHPMVAGGVKTVVFMGRDTQSGVEYYEVAETRESDAKPGAWKRATSPYILRDQLARHFVAVRAVDSAGNRAMVTLPPSVNLSPFYSVRIWSILVVSGVALLFVFGIRRRIKK
ncbi:MAG: hypothetical protein EXS55_00090 [Candidatus Magasanikbacteria bacterium]|nr:hypothetical protein [Candidatus Magasanikbacteria bacterium]